MPEQIGNPERPSIINYNQLVDALIETVNAVRTNAPPRLQDPRVSPELREELRGSLEELKEELNATITPQLHEPEATQLPPVL